MKRNKIIITKKVVENANNQLQQLDELMKAIYSELEDKVLNFYENCNDDYNLFEKKYADLVSLYNYIYYDICGDYRMYTEAPNYRKCIDLYTKYCVNI
ncbi:MAG: hypothetical protein ACK5HL_04350 [Bacilli bacterium]